MKKVLFITNIPSPYRVQFFEEFGKHVNLTVVFEKSKVDYRDDSWFNKESYKNFECYFLEKRNSNNKSIFDFLNKRWDAIIIHNPSTRFGILELLYCRIKKIKHFIEIDGAFVKKTSFLKKIGKKILFSKASGFLSSAKSSDDYLCYYGVSRKNIFRYHFSSISENYILSRPKTLSEVEEARSKLNLKKLPTILSIGRFINVKGFDVLLKSISQLNIDVQLLIVGGEPTDEYIDIINNNNIKNVYFFNFMPFNELSNYFYASNLFVLPTRGDMWGLVINEAMANGLPIISTNKCVAALELIQNNKNGFIVESDNINALSDAIIRTFNCNLEQFGYNSIEIIKKYTIEQMARDHLSFFDLFCVEE